MKQSRREAILTAATCLAVGVGVWSAWVWWYYRDVDRFERPWYAMLPIVNVLAAFAVGAALGWLWTIWDERKRP